MTALLLPLLAVVPVLAAALTAMAPWRAFGRVVTMTVPAVTMLAGLALLVQHRSEPVIATHVGGFVPGIAIPFVSDTFTALMVPARGSVRHAETPEASSIRLTAWLIRDRPKTTRTMPRCSIR